MWSSRPTVSISPPPSKAGRVRPTLCPAGAVCAVLGAAEPSDVCPPGHWCPPGTKTADPLDFVGVRRLAAGGGAVPLLQTLKGAPLGAQAQAPPLTWAAWDEWDSGSPGSYAPGLAYNASARAWGAMYRAGPGSGVALRELPPLGHAPPALAALGFAGVGSGGGGGAGAASAPVLWAERPRPCPIGHYCRAGAASPHPRHANFSTPQP